MSNDIERVLARVRKEFRSEDIQVVERFAKEMLASGLSSARVATYLQYMILIKNGKPFVEWNKDDVVDILSRYKSMVDEGKLSPNTLREIKKTLKKFYSWYGRQDLINWFTLGKSETFVSPQDLITQEEFEMMMRACMNSRDRALIAFLYESGARIGELLSMRIKDVQFDDYGAVVWLPKSKTQRRKLRVVYSAPYLAQWLKDHPFHDSEDAPVWISLTKNFGERIDYYSICRHIKNIAKRAGIKKRIYPHLFRHTRATRLLSKVPEAVGAKYMGWVPGSKMVRVYVHLAQEDVEEKILEMYGIKQSSNGKDLEVKQCPRCYQINDAGSRFCSRCGLPLTEEAVQEVERWEERKSEAIRTMSEPKFLQTFIEMQQEIAKLKKELERIKKEG